MPYGPRRGATSGASEPYIGIANDRLQTGEETVDRRFCTNSGVSLGSSGTLRLTYFTARRTEAITQVRLFSGTTAAGATPTLVRAGIYQEAANQDITLLAGIANDTAIFAAATTAYLRSLTATFNKVKGTRYALGILVVTGAAMPTLPGLGTASAMNNMVLGAPRLAAALTGQTDLPASVVNASLAASGALPYAELVP